MNDTPTMQPDLEALRLKLQQLQDLHQAGDLSDGPYTEACATLERCIVDLVMRGGAKPPATAAPWRPRWLVAGLAAGVLAIALIGIAWTRWSGTPAVAATAAAPEASASAPHPLGSEQIAGMVATLQQRLKDHPDDADGWVMLARSYVVLGRHADAVPAYKKAVALRGDDATLLADYADALAVSNGRQLEGEPLALVQKALQHDPDNLKALSLAGTAAFDRKDYAGAAAQWQHIVAVAPPGSDYLQQVLANIAEARELGGLPAAVADAPQIAKAATAAPAAPPGGSSVTGTVSLAPSLRAQAAPDDTVFVFARAADGPRMPLAIVRKQVKDLPFTFRLDDTLAMSPTMKISAFQQVVVGARVSKSGNAVAQPGDLSGQSAPVAVGAQGLKIEISQVAPP